MGRVAWGWVGAGLGIGDGFGGVESARKEGRIGGVGEGRSGMIGPGGGPDTMT